MTVENYLLPEELHTYARRVSLRETEIQRELRAETAEFPGKNMQIPPEMGQFLAFLVELTGAKNILELGTFTGYGALAMALAMPEGGRVIACDINEAAHIGRWPCLPSKPLSWIRALPEIQQRWWPR